MIIMEFMYIHNDSSINAEIPPYTIDILPNLLMVKEYIIAFNNHPKSEKTAP